MTCYLCVKADSLPCFLLSYCGVRTFSGPLMSCYEDGGDDPRQPRAVNQTQTQNQSCSAESLTITTAPSPGCGFAVKRSAQRPKDCDILQMLIVHKIVLPIGRCVYICIFSCTNIYIYIQQNIQHVYIQTHIIDVLNFLGPGTRRRGQRARCDAERKVDPWQRKASPTIVYQNLDLCEQRPPRLPLHNYQKYNSMLKMSTGVSGVVKVSCFQAPRQMT